MMTKKAEYFNIEVKIEQTAYVKNDILPQRGKKLQGQYPCVCDKFHVWWGKLFYISCVLELDGYTPTICTRPSPWGKKPV